MSKGAKFGYIDKLGNLKIPFKYALANVFSDGLAAVFNGKNWGYIDELDRQIIPSQFGSFEGRDGEQIANPFINGLACVFLGEGQAYLGEEYKNQFALIDKTGKIFNNQNYDFLRLLPLESGKFEYEAVKNGKTVKLDTFGRIINN